MNSATTPMISEIADNRKEQRAWLLIALHLFATSVTSFFLAVFFKEKLGFTGSQIGVLFSIQAITGVLVTFPAGMGNDRISSRTLIVGSLIVQSAFFFLMGTVKFYPLYLLIFFVWNSANMMLRLSIDVYVLKNEKGEKTASSLGWYLTWRFFGAFCGTITVGFLIKLLDFEITLYLAGAFIFMLLFVAKGLEARPLSKVRLSDYKADFSNPTVLFFAAWTFMFSTHWGAEMTCYGLFLREDLKLDFTGIGLYTGGEYLTMALTFAYVASKYKPETSLWHYAVIGLAASGIGHIGMIFHPVWLSFTFRIVHGVGDALIFALFYIGIFRLFKLERRGGNTGLMNMTTMLGMIVGSLVYSPLGEVRGYAMPLWISGALTLLLILPLYSNRVRKGMKKRNDCD